MDPVELSSHSNFLTFSFFSGSNHNPKNRAGQGTDRK